jgi:hypothetical protein
MCHNTTHDWAADVDGKHLAQIRQQPNEYAPTGLEHLVLEVLDTRPTRRSLWAVPAAHE